MLSLKKGWNSGERNVSTGLDITRPAIDGVSQGAEMARFLKSVMLFASLGVPIASRASDAALVVVRDTAPGITARLLSEGVIVVRDMDDHLLAVAGPEATARMAELGLTWDVLDPSTEGKTYFTVFVRGEPRLEEIESRVRVLMFEGLHAVVEASQAEAEELAAMGHEIARLFLRPIRLPRASKSLPRVAHEWDSLVQAMVESVSSARIDAHVQRLQDFVTRYASHDSCRAAAEHIKAEFESFGIDSVYFDDFALGEFSPNVVAVMLGVEHPEDVYVLGGHYDSITSNIGFCPGADDNASGTACVLECARILSDYRFNKTLIFVAFGAEELGLYGSQAYAGSAATREENIVGMVNVDMIGYLVHPDSTVDLDVITNASSWWLWNAAEWAAAEYVPGFPVIEGRLPSYASSDHVSFWNADYDAIMFHEDWRSSPHIHGPDDVVGISYNSPELAEKSVKVAVALMASLAEPESWILITHAPLTDTEESDRPLEVLADIRAARALDPDSVFVHYETSAGDTATVPMQSLESPFAFEATIPPQPRGTFLDYYIVAQDTDGNRRTSPPNAPADVYSIFVGTISTLFFDDLEAERGWAVGAPEDGATAGVWEWADPTGSWWNDVQVQPEDDHTPSPGTKCFVTANAAPGAPQAAGDVDGGKTTLLSPLFDLSNRSNAHVRYYRWFTNDTGADPTDPWIVDVSADGGASWVRLETLSTSRREWERVERRLTDYIPLSSQVRFRFIAADDGEGSVVEAAIDDLEIVTYEEPSGPLPREVSAIVLARSGPGRFDAPVHIRFGIPSPGRKVTLRIFDVTGRQVSTLVDGETVVGIRDVSWDGRDRAGRRVASGIYFVRLKAGGETVSRQFPMIR